MAENSAEQKAEFKRNSQKEKAKLALLLYFNVTYMAL